MVWGWDKAPHNWLKLFGILNRLKLTTSLQSSMSSTVLSSWTQASRSGLLELSSSCPLNWSVIRGNKTSLQSKSTRKNMRGVDDTQLLVRVDEKKLYVDPNDCQVLPGCLNRLLSTIFTRQPSFCLTIWKSGMLSMNLASWTLWKKERFSKKKQSGNYKLITWFRKQWHTFFNLNANILDTLHSLYRSKNSRCLQACHRCQALYLRSTAPETFCKSVVMAGRHLQYTILKLKK